MSTQELLIKSKETGFLISQRTRFLTTRASAL